jgi:hypothetical protein
MGRLCAVILLLSALGAGMEKKKNHADYVPDEKTAKRIGEAVLIARFGEARVQPLLPLLVASHEDFWIVQVSRSENGITTGGGMAVWINKHSGCIVNLVKRMK